MPAHAYLRPDVIIEPLMNKWHATPLLVAPATSAMLFANKCLPIMRSFLLSPDEHFAASKNPQLAGGPFVAYPPSRVPDVKALIDRTLQDQAPLFELAGAIKKLSTALDGAAGDSLESRYNLVPPALRGRVELVYDPADRPSFRFIERLLYRHFARPSAQSVTVYASETDERPFALSTPRLLDPPGIHLDVSFGDPKLSALASMRSRPRPLAEISELLSVSAHDAAAFASFFTEQAPPPRPAYEEDTPRVRYIGHACVLVECGGASMLFDPFIGYENERGIPRYSYASLPDVIDCLVITHAHLDHCVPETLIQLRHKTKTVIVPKSSGGRLVDPSLKLVVEALGFTDVRELDEFETFAASSQLGVTAVPFFGEHGDLEISAKAAYVVNANGKKIMLAADSNVLDPEIYENVRDFVGPVDVLFLGMECVGAPMSWSYGPLFPKPPNRKFDQQRRINGANCERGLSLVDSMKPAQVFIYAMGQEPWMTHVMGLNYEPTSPQLVESQKFIETCKARGLVAERLYGRAEIYLP